jgi:hypothetical protein
LLNLEDDEKIREILTNGWCSDSGTI